jgi:hypothetical protein
VGDGVDEADAFLHLVAVLLGIFAFGRDGRLVAGDTVLVREQPGDHRGERRAAEARRHVAALEQAALPGQAVEVWRLDGFVAHEAVIGPRLVVGDDKHDVGRLGGERVGGQQQPGDEGKESALNAARLTGIAGKSQNRLARHTLSQRERAREREKAAEHSSRSFFTEPSASGIGSVRNEQQRKKPEPD